MDLEQVRRIRMRHGGTANDVMLAVVSGAMRDWFSGRGHAVDGLNPRALIPVSSRARSGNRANGNQMSGYLCELPVGEPDPAARLRHIRLAMERSKAAGTRRGPGAIPLLADQLPPVLHKMAAPAAGQAASLLFDILVTSVPLPGIPMRLAGAELAEVFPVAPLAPTHALGVAMSSYRGRAYVGLHADREAMPDLDGLAAAIPAAAAALED
jgi:WS/DGAT/MGAT family acyltransferase